MAFMLAALFLVDLSLSKNLSDKSRPVAPVGNPAEWINTNDYPRQAARENWTGITTFELQIDSKGVPQHCDVAESSGYGLLDGMTCGLLMGRARFEPALNGEGTPVWSKYMSRVSWQLPDDQVPTVADEIESEKIAPAIPKAKKRGSFYEFALELSVNADGGLIGCALRSAVPSLEQDVVCRDMQTGYLPIQMDEQGKPKAYKAIFKASLQPE